MTDKIIKPIVCWAYQSIKKLICFFLLIKTLSLTSELGIKEIKMVEYRKMNLNDFDKNV